MSTPVCSAVEVFREVCKRILCSLLGESACTAILFYLRKSLGRDPFEVFWDNPKVFYRELEGVLGFGAKLLIELLVSRINSEFSLNMSSERFLELIRSGDQHSIEEVRSFIMKMVESYKGKGGVYDER